MRQGIPTAFLLALLASVRPMDLPAYQCGPQPPCSVVRPDTVVFVGNVLDPGVDPSLGRERPAVLEVVEPFAGLDPKTRFVEIVGIKPWEKVQGLWLVTAVRLEGGQQMQIDFCGNLGPVDTMQAELDYLRRRARGEAPTRIYGSAQVFFDGAAGFEIVAKSDGGEYRTRTRPDGTFEFPSVLPGVYELRLVIPPAERHLYRPVPPDRWEGIEQPGDRNEVEVLPGTCAGSGFELDYNGSVSGTAIHEDGEPAADIALQLDPVDDDKLSRRRRTVKTDAQGQFTFEGVNPGRYRLGVNILPYPRNEPYPVTYFPKGSEAPYAEVLSLAKLQSIDSLRFVLPNPMGRRTIDVVVVDSKGEPVQGANLANVPATREHFHDLPTSSKTDDKGRISIQAVAAVRYAFMAGKGGPKAGDEILSSGAVVIPPGTQPVSVRLTLEEDPDSVSIHCEWDAVQETLIAEKSRYCEVVPSGSE
jgi:hypothetical protein